MGNAPSTLYSRRDSAVVVGGGRTYELRRIRDLPPEEKPREKLLAHGAAVLTPQELLAVVLNVGTSKEDITAMTTRIVKEYGEKSLAGQRDAKKLSEDLNVPLGKAAQIVACLELGRRFFKTGNGARPLLRTPKEVFRHTRDMGRLAKEHLRGLYLDTHFRLIHEEIITIGTVDANIIHPREVFRPAIEYAAAAVILVHNHPSGATTASAADCEVTAQLITAGRIMGIDLLDHVVVTATRCASVPADYSSA